MSGIPQMVSDLGGKVVTSLPAQFLALVLLNTAFILGLLWFLEAVDTRHVAAEQAGADARERMLTPILTECIKQSNVVHEKGG